MAQVSRWERESFGVMCEETIRSRLEHPERFRITTYTYPAGAAFRGSSRRSTLYVLTGGLSYRAAGVSTILENGEYCEVSEGEYDFVADGEYGVHFVRVTPLPQAFWQPVPDPKA